MKFVTFNIRTEAQDDGVNRFYFRRGLILDRIEKEQPDIIGFQELKQEMFSYMKSHLLMLGYTLVGCGRGADYKNEHNPIAFKTDKYELIGLDVSWLSETPYTPGSRYPVQSSCPRIITHAILKAEDEDTPFHVFNTHLDHREQDARVRGAKRVLEHIDHCLENAPFPVILCGDFNAYPDTEEVKIIKNSSLGLTEVTSGIGTTYHGWGKSKEDQIDYIFVKGFESKAPISLWSEDLNGVYLSDHYPVCAILE